MESVIRFVEEPVAGLADRRRKVWLECDGSPYDFRAVDVLGTRFVVTTLRQSSSTARAAARNTSHCCLVDALKRSRLLEMASQERAERRFGHSRRLPSYLQQCGLG